MALFWKKVLSQVFGPSFPDFCTKFDTRILLYSWISGIWCRHKHDCLPVMTVSDWMAAVRSCWLRASRTTSRHVQKSLPHCDIKYKRSELNAYMFWSSLIHGCENTALNLLNYSTIQRWVVSFMLWLSLYRLDRKLRGPRFGLVIWRREKSLTPTRNHPLITPLSSSWCIHCTKNYSGVNTRCGAGMCPTT